jgi:Xaa-Pro aminopeptidase
METRRLENGMAFSVEPGIYFANDFGVRIEDAVVIEECRGRRLNSYPRELIVV